MAHLQRNEAANPEILDQRRELVTQLGAVSALIERNIQDLTQPMTVILGLNELILPRTDPGSDLAADLVAITHQIERMSQIVGEVTALVEQRKKLLQVLEGLHLNSARLAAGAPGHVSMREEQQ